MEEATKKIGLRELTKTFLFIGLTSFGGGLTAYIRRIIVDNKQWLNNAEFFPGLALSQLLPGANVVGISLYIGNHLCGLWGAFIASCCIIIPPALFLFVVGYFYFMVGAVPAMESILKGVAAVACGLMTSMFVEAAEASLKNSVDVIIFLSTFLLVKVLHLHVPYVILIMAPLAIWWYRPATAKQQQVKVEVEGEARKDSLKEDAHE